MGRPTARRCSFSLCAHLRARAGVQTALLHPGARLFRMVGHTRGCAEVTALCICICFELGRWNWLGSSAVAKALSSGVMRTLFMRSFVADLSFGSLRGLWDFCPGELDSDYSWTVVMEHNFYTLCSALSHYDGITLYRLHTLLYTVYSSCCLYILSLCSCPRQMSHCPPQAES